MAVRNSGKITENERRFFCFSGFLLAYVVLNAKYNWHLIRLSFVVRVCGHNLNTKLFSFFFSCLCSIKQYQIVYCMGNAWKHELRTAAKVYKKNHILYHTRISIFFCASTFITSCVGYWKSFLWLFFLFHTHLWHIKQPNSILKNLNKHFIIFITSFHLFPCLSVHFQSVISYWLCDASYFSHISEIWSTIKDQISLQSMYIKHKIKQQSI